MKQLTQSEVRKNGKVYKNVSSPATEGTMKQVTDIVEKDGTFSISTDGGKTYSPAGGDYKNLYIVGRNKNDTNEALAFNGSMDCYLSFDKDTFVVEKTDDDVLEVKAKGTAPEALPQEASALKSGNLPTSGWTDGDYVTYWTGSVYASGWYYYKKLFQDNNIYSDVVNGVKFVATVSNQAARLLYNHGIKQIGDGTTSCPLITGYVLSFDSTYKRDNEKIIITEDGNVYGTGSYSAGSDNGAWWKMVGKYELKQKLYIISDTDITANSDILMELIDEGGVKAYSMEAGKMTVIRDTVPTQPIPYTYKVKQTNASGQFTVVNHYVPNVPVTSVNGQTGAVTGLATTDEVNKKQDTLTETQLAAVNSGITEAKRTKYDGYEATINQKANSADLAQVATSGSYNDLKDKPTIPPAITESVVSGWGFTKNTGTVTSVAVKMNGTTKGTVTNSGTIDLGTVITSHQDISGKQDKLTPGDNISIVSNTISVTGLGTAAFKNTGDFATAAQGALAASAVQTVVTSTKDGNISVDGTDVAVKGLKTLAFKDSLAKADVGLGNVENKTMDTAPTANSENYVTSGGVKTYIDNVIAAVEQFQYEVVSVLPAASADTMGKIYLVADEHSSTDNYDEFITLDNKGAYVWEKIGNTDIDLSGYVKNTTTIAGVDFKDNITKTELLTALNVADGATKVNEATVTDWGFTKNKGTVNSIKMNGKPVTITDGAVDFGTVITSHQSLDSKQDKITSSNKIDASLVSGLAKVATTGSYTDLSNKPTILSEEDVKGIKVNNATNADSAGYVKNSIVCQGVGMNADANYSNFVTYDGSAARSIKFYKYDFQMLDALGSGDAELTLRNTGVTAGTYNSVTVDTKGRVTAGTNTPIDTSNLVPKSAFSLSGTTLTITV